jgi:hypothetical protein
MSIPRWFSAILQKKKFVAFATLHMWRITMSNRFGFTTLSFERIGDGYAVTGIRKSNGKALVRYFYSFENASRQVEAWDSGRW